MPASQRLRFTRGRGSSGPAAVGCNRVLARRFLAAEERLANDEDTDDRIVDDL